MIERVLGDPAFAAAVREVAADIAGMGAPDEVAAAGEEHVTAR